MDISINATSKDSNQKLKEIFENKQKLSVFKKNPEGYPISLDMQDNCITVTIMNSFHISQKRMSIAVKDFVEEHGLLVLDSGTATDTIRVAMPADIEI